MKAGDRKINKIMKRSKMRKIFTLLLLLCFFVNIAILPVYAEPDEETSEETSEETWSESTEETWTEEHSYGEDYAESFDDEESSDDTEEQSEAEENDSENLDEEGNPKPYTDTSKPPKLGAKSAAIYCRNTGGMVVTYNSEKRVCPYSVTKLLTAFLAVQRLPMDQKVVVSEAAASQPGSSMDLYEGEEVTVEQLLYGALVLSGNDASYALAEAVSGDVDGFVKLMNETASNIGCKNTHFANPHGYSYDVDEHYTTANDMMNICKVVFANETVNKIAGTTKYEMPQTNISDRRVMEGHNVLLNNQVDGYVSGKTGWMPDAYATLAMNYKKDGLDLIIVIFEASVEGKWTDCENLVKYAVSSIKGVTVFQEGELIGKVRVRHGAETRVDALTGSDCVVYLPKAASQQLISCESIIYDDVTAPIRQGDVVGKYQVFVANELVDEVPLVASKGIKEGWLPSYVGISNQATLIGGGLLVLLIILIIIRISIGIRNRRQRKRAHKAKVRALARKQMEEEKREFDSHRGKFYK